MVIPARNEANYIEKTIKSLLWQTLKPSTIIVVDDGSSDETASIAKKMGVTVLSRQDRGYDVLSRPEFCDTWNLGLKFLNDIGNIDFVMILDADQILERDYIEKIIRVMKGSSKVVLASGRIVGEASRSPRNSGRIINFKFFRSIGFYPHVYESETYPSRKALEMGYEIRIVKDALSFGQRKTRFSFKKMYAMGKGRRAMGYDPTYFLWNFAVVFLESSPKGAISMMVGYLSSDTPRYSDFGKWQRKTIVKRLFKKLLARL